MAMIISLNDVDDIPIVRVNMDTPRRNRLLCGLVVVKFTSSSNVMNIFITLILQNRKDFME